MQMSKDRLARSWLSCSAGYLFNMACPSRRGPLTHGRAAGTYLHTHTSHTMAGEGDLRATCDMLLRAGCMVPSARQPLPASGIRHCCTASSVLVHCHRDRRQHVGGAVPIPALTSATPKMTSTQLKARFQKKAIHTLWVPGCSSSVCTVCSLHSVSSPTLDESATANTPVSTPVARVITNFASVCPVYLQDI